MQDLTIVCECVHHAQVRVVEELRDGSVRCTFCNALVAVCMVHTDTRLEEATPDLILNNQHGLHHCGDRGDGLGREGGGR